MIKKSPYLIALSIFFYASLASAQTATFFGPTPYLQQSDTPAGFSALPVVLEDAEDSVLDPDLSTAATIIGPGGLTDSVDIDDGVIDGSGTNGRSLFSGSPVRVTFISRPISAGLVWTDGGGGANVSFEAFDAAGVSLGTHGPFVIGDNSNFGATDEDRFFGVRYAQGISAILITHTSGGYEIDHIQWTNDRLFQDGFE